MTWRVFLLGILFVASSIVPAPGAESTAERNQAYIRRLTIEPVEDRRVLISKIRREATPGAKHPPTETSDRTDLLPVLDAALANDDDGVRTEAICALCYMKNRETFPILEKASESPFPSVRYYACMGVQWLAEEPALRVRAITVLQKALDRPGESFSIRLHASASLDELGVKQEATIFIEALRNPRANEAMAAGVLARMRRKDTIELMIGRLKTAVPSGDHWLSEALKSLTGEDFGTNAETWQRWLEANRPALPEQIK
jgi:hypothetical protein